MRQGDGDGEFEQRVTVMRGYDELADVYADERGSHDDGALVERVDDDAPDGRVLDAGCGDGRPVLTRLEDRAVLGVDFSRTQVTKAATVAPGRVLQGDMTALPVADDSAAAVTALYSVIHVPAGQHADVYEEFARVLQSGGVLVVTTGTEDWTGRSEDWLDGGAPMEWEILGPEATTERLEAAGFAVYDAFGLVDTVGDEVERDEGDVVDPDSEEAEKLLLFARLVE